MTRRGRREGGWPTIDISEAFPVLKSPQKEIFEASKRVKALLTVEMSMGQMVDDVRLAANGNCPVEFYGRTGGVIPTPAEVLEKVKEILAGGDR